MSATASELVILARLEGAWTIDRRISNGATLMGHAVFTPDNGGLAYRETGQLRLVSGQVFAAERAYRFEERPYGFDVFFAGRDTYLFHAITLRRDGERLIGEGEHPCRDDLYRTRYMFEPGEKFTITHAVQGPRHDYTMETAYRRS